MFSSSPYPARRHQRVTSAVSDHFTESLGTSAITDTMINISPPMDAISRTRSIVGRWPLPGQASLAPSE
jgi:hypothetical protein